MTQWIARAWERLHIENRQTIINTFRHVGLSLNPNGSEDSELKIRDLPGITVGDYNQASTPNQPILIPNDTSDIVTACERLQGITEMEEDEAEVTTDSSDDTESHFDEEDSDLDFDEALDGDEDAGDYNMR
jgi:hypothetical protein